LNHANVHTTTRYMKAGGDELSEWLTSTTPAEPRHLPGSELLQLGLLIGHA
jgi:hypothetical protein